MTRFDRWFKSSYSEPSEGCVEVALAQDGTVGIRDSKDTTGPNLAVDPHAWRTFIHHLRNRAR